AGLVSVPVNYKLPAETVAYIVGDCDAKLVIGDDTRLKLAPDSVLKISFDKDLASLLGGAPVAPLNQLNGLSMCQPTRSHGDPIVLLPQFTTRGYIEAAARHRVASLTSVPT